MPVPEPPIAPTHQVKRCRGGSPFAARQRASRWWAAKCVGRDDMATPQRVLLGEFGLLGQARVGSQGLQLA